MACRPCMKTRYIHEPICMKNNYVHFHNNINDIFSITCKNPSAVVHILQTGILHHFLLLFLEVPYCIDHKLTLLTCV